MDVISFTIDHRTLKRGVYVSRRDFVGGHCVTTFDIRIKEPNREPVIDMPALHTLEHLMAVYLRSAQSGFADELIYVGPMGCRTGMYMVVKGDLTSFDVLPVLKSTFEYIADFKGEIPAARPEQCGNYLEHNAAMAAYESRIFLDEILDKFGEENAVYTFLKD